MKQYWIGAFLAVVIFSAPAFAVGEGTAVGVDPDAVARADGRERILEIGTDVSVGERVVTGPKGQVQIVFDDNTRLVIGPGSSLLIETYLLASANIAQKLTINALGGSFRFITGNSPKPAYSIKTPTAAIAVRGTEFDLVVLPSSTRIMLYKGALQICTTGNACDELADRCAIGVTSQGQVAVFGPANSQRGPLSLAFRYARFQTPLLAQFRVNGAANCAGTRSDSGAPDSLVNANEGAPDTQTRPQSTSKD